MTSSASFGGQGPLVSFQWHVYILKCTDDTYYVGRTTNLEDRMHRHNMGYVKYTSTRLPIQLIVFLSFADEWKAVQMEQYLKSGSGRAFAKKHFY